MKIFKLLKPQKPIFLRKLPRQRPFLYGLAKNKCTECLQCEVVCPVKAIDIIAFPETAQKKTQSSSLPDKKNIYKFYMDFSKCIYCNLCVQTCPSQALFVQQGEIPVACKKSQLKKDLLTEKTIISKT